MPLDLKTKYSPSLPSIPIEDDANDPERQRAWRIAHADALIDLYRTARIDFENVTEYIDNNVDTIYLDIEDLQSQINTKENSLSNPSSDYHILSSYANGVREWVDILRALGRRFQYVLAADVKANGVDGGTFTSGSWIVRTLTQKLVDTGNIASLSANVLYVPKGKYIVVASAPGCSCGPHRIRLANAAGAVYANANGINTRAVTDSCTLSILVMSVELSANNSFRVEHRCGTTVANFGLGRACGFGSSEIYTMLQVWRFADD